ncbi:MAG: helicase-associated domain-containing protein [Nitrososphaerota archaeon]|jgi:hypothetical protein|nr:helicase-associated domain-containing protein [Nitrososphaerota archaeon]
MSEMAKLVEYLNNCINDTAYGNAEGTGLDALYKTIFGNKTPVHKTDMVKNLSDFYSNKQNIIDIWNGLSECEQDFIRYVINGNGEFLPTTLFYAKKHNLKLVYVAPGGYKKTIADLRYMHLRFLHLLSWNIPNTKTVLLFPGGNLPHIIFNVLKNIVGPIEFLCGEYVPTKTDYIICRENRVSDFATIVKLATSERLKVKPETFDLTPAKLAKLSELVGFEEVCDNGGKFCPPKDAKNRNDFKVAQPLFVLAANSGLIGIDKAGTVLPGANSTDLLSRPPNELAKILFNDYFKRNNLAELHYTTYLKVSDGYMHVNWLECRNSIIELLKNCPIEKFLTFEDFDNNAKLFCGNFFRRLVYGGVMARGYACDNYLNSVHEPDWGECESQLIRVILSFLSAIGMVDIAYTENVSRIRCAVNDSCVGMAGFRITKLGAWIFGRIDKYETTKTISTLNDEGQLQVLPDYSIVISGLKCRIEHETILSKFLTRVSVDANAAVYKLDFPSIIRAHDFNITPQKIKKTLEKASGKPLPDNVSRSLDGWQLKIGRVKIHTLTVIETDDALLLEEIKHIKGIGDIITNEMSHVVAIDKEQQKKAKTLIEKNGWPVKIGYVPI